METGETLRTLAEVSVAFAGFAGVVTAFRSRSPDAWGDLDVFRFRFMVEFSLVTLLLSLLPLLVSAFGFADATVWMVCSAFLAIGSAFYLTRAVVQVRRLLARGFPVSRRLAVVCVVLGIAIALSATGNMLHLFARPDAVYLAGTGGCLFVCSALFARLLLARPATPSEDDETE